MSEELPETLLREEVQLAQEIAVLKQTIKTQEAQLDNALEGQQALLQERVRFRARIKRYENENSKMWVNLRELNDKYGQELVRMTAERDKAREALRMVEFVYAGWTEPYCPWCDGRDVHKPNCPRQLALGSEK